MATTHRATVGKKRTVEYCAWAEIIARCTRSSHAAYARYGGRGIRVCKRWMGPRGFENFLADVGPRPSNKHSIDRYPNNDGNYEPTNVRWATAREQTSNRRTNRIITHNGESLILSEWARRAGISVQGLSDRITRGWSFSDAISIRPGKARYPSGADSPHCVLTPQDAEDVRWRCACGERRRAIAHEYGVSVATIDNIVNRKHY